MKGKDNKITGTFYSNGMRMDRSPAGIAMAKIIDDFNSEETPAKEVE